MTTLRQLSFAGGELAPSLHGRTDISKYATGLRTCKNAFVAKHGGVYNRPGTEYVCEVGRPDLNDVKLHKFVFSNDQTYILEFGDTYVRIVKDGGQILNTAQNIFAISNANPCVLKYSGADILSVGDEFYVSGITGNIGDYLNGRNFLVAAVSSASNSITNVTQANPAVVTYSGSDNYSNGDVVYISGVAGMTELNGNRYTIANVNTGANTFELSGTNSTGYTAYTSGGTAKKAYLTLDYLDGTNVDSTSFGSYTSGGTIAEVYEVVSAYSATEVFDIQIVQSGDVLTIVHPDHPVRTLSRTADNAWTFATVDFESVQDKPVGLTQTNAGAGTAQVQYVVTAVTESGVESLPATGTQRAITAITSANPCVLTLNRTTKPETLILPGDVVLISGVDGNMTQLNNRYFRVGAVAYPSGTTQTITLLGEDTSGVGAWSGTTGLCVSHSITVIGGLAPITVTWGGTTSGVRTYNVYRRTIDANGVVYYPWGLITTVAAQSYYDNGSITPDYDLVPPDFLNKFTETENYPSVVSYYQQRLVLASPTDNPENVRFSKIGDFYNFSYRSPIQDDDTIEFTMAGRKINRVKHILDIGQCIVFTDSGEWVLQGDQSGALTPSSINPKQYSYYGSSSLPPIPIDNTALYVQARGNNIRDLAFDYQVEGYKGNDLSIFANHLFENYTIVDWDYQNIPNSIIWCVRNDGAVLGLTYIREHQIWGWHRHDLAGGIAKSIACVPEGTEDAVYVVVERTVGSSTKMFIERLSSRRILTRAGVEFPYYGEQDSIFMDSAISYDGRNVDAAHTMTLSEYSGGGWLYTSTVTLTSSASYFVSTDVDKEIHIKGSDGTIIRFHIDTYVSGTVVRGKPDKTIPAGMRSTAIYDWSKAIQVVKGLWHLNGEAVSVLGDAYVLASPNNDQYDVLTVTNGQITLDDYYSVIHVGLPYITDIETLDIDTDSVESIADKNKFVSKVSMHVEKTRGLFVGPEAPSDDDTDPLENLIEVKMRENEDYDSQIELASKVIDVNIKPEWDSNGRVFIRQVDPVPMGILSIMPSGLFPFPGRR
jgi:hypothetical protein